MDKENLSKQGKEILDTHGYHEETLPYVDNPGPVRDSDLCYMTIDFVLDDENRKELEDLPLDYRSEWVAEHLGDIIENGWVLEVNGDGPVDSLEALEEKLSEIQLFKL